MSELVKSAVLMERIGANEQQRVAIFSADDEPPFRHEHRLPYETWEDLGRPGEITVVIYPGDGLNDRRLLPESDKDALGS